MKDRDGELPRELAMIPTEMIIEVDVREDLNSGREPLGRIMAARHRVPEGGALAVRAIFEPVPLYRVLGNEGFLHHTERLGDEDWRVWFYRPARGKVAPTGPDAGRKAEDAEGHGGGPESEDGVLVLDVRDLEPPEPLARTLSALETLPEGGTLVHINRRIPQLLFPLLKERGFTHEIRQEEPDLVRVTITRAAAGPDAESAR